jgi:hypothetical protein
LTNSKREPLTVAFSNEDAKQFGKLSKTATWETLLKTYGIPLQAVDSVVDTKLNRLTQVIGLTTALAGLQLYPPEFHQFFRLG